MDDLHSSISGTVLSAVTVGKMDNEKSTAMKAGEWVYEWYHINETMSIYARYRDEYALDGMPKPFLEILAYMQKLIDTVTTETVYRALLPVSDRVEELQFPRSRQSIVIMRFVEDYYKP